MVSECIEEAIAQAEKMLCPKGLSHTGENNRSEHGHTECWVIGELLDEIERLRAALKDADDDFHALKAMFDNMRNERDQLRARLGLEESGQISTVDRIADLHDQIVRLVSGYND